MKDHISKLLTTISVVCATVMMGNVWGDVIKLDETIISETPEDDLLTKIEDTCVEISNGKNDILVDKVKMGFPAEMQWQAQGIAGYVDGHIAHIYVGAKRPMKKNTSPEEKLGGRGQDLIQAEEYAHTERQLIGTIIKQMRSDQHVPDEMLKGTIVVKIENKSPCDNPNDPSAGGLGCLEYYDLIAKMFPKIKFVVYVQANNLAMSGRTYIEYNPQEEDKEVYKEYLRERMYKEMCAISEIINQAMKASGKKSKKVAIGSSHDQNNIIDAIREELRKWRASWRYYKDTDDTWKFGNKTDGQELICWSSGKYKVITLNQFKAINASEENISGVIADLEEILKKAGESFLPEYKNYLREQYEQAQEDYDESKAEYTKAVEENNEAEIKRKKAEMKYDEKVMNDCNAKIVNTTTHPQIQTYIEAFYDAAFKRDNLEFKFVQR